MDKTINSIMMDMIDYYESDPKRIQHFIKVYSFSKLICENENTEENTQIIIKIAALVHDIGIKKAEELYGSSSGKLQEELGPSIAEVLLEKYKLDINLISRISYLVGHHHSYKKIDGIDYQILVESDFLVNMYEDRMNRESILSAYEKIFRTSSGKNICRKMFADCFLNL